jgi:hypothetical protein
VPTLAVIIQNFKRPQNIALVVRNARAALPDTPIFLLDQADEPGLRLRDDIPWNEVWYQKAAVNRGAGARVPIAASLPVDLYLAIDDDTFLTPEQIATLTQRLLAEPDRAHGIWGQRVELDGGRLKVRSNLGRVDAAISMLNLAYGFSRGQAQAALALAGRLGFAAWPERDPIDDILLSCGSTKAPLCHNVGALAFCATSVTPGIATWKEADFNRRRMEIIQRLAALQAIAIFRPPEAP